MRILEIGIAAGLLSWALLMQLPYWPIGAAALVVLVSVIAGCHLVWEGWRWQMVSAYVSIVGLILYECVHWGFGYLASPITVAAVAISAVTAVAGCIAMPVFKLPLPTGSHAIGTVTRQLVDKGRPEPFSDDPRARRELVIQIWYPAEPVKERRSSPYRERRSTTLKSAHLHLVKAHSTPDAKVDASPEKFPVLIYTPSWSGIRTECTILIEELASHGYVVVAIDHPYCSSTVAFPDGRILRRKFQGEEDYSSDEALARFVRTADEQVRLRAEDARFVLDTLERLNESDPQGLFTRRLILDRVGIFGYSLGGGTAAQTCLTDSRFKAGIDMGGMIAGDVPTQGVPVPFLFMFEGMYEASPFGSESDIGNVAGEKLREIEFVRTQFRQMKSGLSRAGGYWMVIQGIRHWDFSDAPFLSPFRRTHLDLPHVRQALDKCVLAYFDLHVRGRAGSLLEGRMKGDSLVKIEYLEANGRVAGTSLACK